MRRISVLGLLCGFVGVCLVAAAPASAATVTYTFVDASATFGAGTSDFSGTFGWDNDPGTEYITFANITVTGFDAGSYRGGPTWRDRMAAWLRWILGSITPPISPRLPA